MRIFFLPVLLISLLLAHFSVRAEPTVLEVIPLKHRTVEQVLPTIQPFLDRQGAINGMNNQLIIRTTPSNLSQIKEILRQIDTSPRQLMITVKQSAQRETDADETELSGSVGLGDNARVIVPGSGRVSGGVAEIGRGNDELRGRVFSRKSVGSDSGTQQLRVIEGGQAFISVGKSVPVQERTIVRNGQVVTVVDGTSYRDVTSGFYVRPRISGDRVTLEIVPQNNTVDEHGRINVQQVNTVVSGRLGEWMELGGINQSRSGSQSGTVYSSQEQGSDQRQIMLKVDEIK